MSDEQKPDALWFGMPVRFDESVPVGDINVAHPDGRVDKFMIVENEVLPIHVTKLGDPPSWVCPFCSYVCAKQPKACESCGMEQ